jgi:HSP20 family protein
MLIRRESTPTAVTIRDPFAFLRRMTSELDRVFEGPPWPVQGSRGMFEPNAWTPSIEVFEKDHRFVARFDLPGVKKEEVNIEVVEGELVVSGERKREEEEKKEHFHRSEREYGSFYRSILLPEGAKTENVTATFTNGVLEVTVPLAEVPERRRQKIAIGEAKKPAA